jgi:hypothetical protein
MDTTKILTDLRAQRDRLNQAIAALESLNASASAPQTSKNAAKTSTAAALNSAPHAGKRVISDEARQRMAEAQRKRWAKKKRAAKAASVTTVKPAKAAAKKAAPKSSKGGITAAGRKRISEAAKARWAAKKAAATVPAAKALTKGATT